MKVWCSRCYGMIRTMMLKKYGDYQLENVDMVIKQTSKGIEQTVSYPILKIRVPVKTKRGFSKSCTQVVMPFSLKYCPFCGKEIQTCGDDYEENEE